MNELKWDKRLETGIPVIDNQHKEIFKRIDKLELAILNGEEKKELIQLIQFLEQYAVEHFSAEERLLSDIHYPQFSNHCLEHKKFRIMCKELSLEHQNKGPDQYLAIQTDKKMREWWEHHILQSDMFFAPYFKKENWKYL